MTYLDHAATTQPRAEVLQAMWPYLTNEFGNASSVHERGQHAAEALNRARTVLAELTGFRPSDIVFTSGGTEADNLGIVGLALANPRGRHIVSARTEHDAVLQSIAWLERIHGFETSWVEAQPDGSMLVESLHDALRPNTTLVSLMLVNNEIGTVNPIAELTTAAHAVGALVHCDAVQAAGWFDLRGLGVDALAISGHKIGAPQGVGAALIRSHLPLEPTVWGGGQQDGRRSGTENVAGAVALATALALAERDRLAGASERIAALRDRLIDGVLTLAPQARLTGPGSIRPLRSLSGGEAGIETRRTEIARAPHIASFVFEHVNGEALLIELERHGVICSSGSACAAGRTDPSHVLLALGFPPALAHTSVRFSLGHDTTELDINQALTALAASLKSLAPEA
ncbi:MAG: cysteine desulfurase family protein [Microbacteriaceae bacterium]